MDAKMLTRASCKKRKQATDPPEIFKFGISLKNHKWMNVDDVIVTLIVYRVKTFPAL